MSVRLTESYLRQVIREELKTILSEGMTDDFLHGLHSATGGYLGRKKPKSMRQLDLEREQQKQIDAAKASDAAYAKQKARSEEERKNVEIQRAAAEQAKKAGGSYSSNGCRPGETLDQCAKRVEDERRFQNKMQADSEAEKRGEDLRYTRGYGA